MFQQRLWPLIVLVGALGACASNGSKEASGEPAGSASPAREPIRMHPEQTFAPLDLPTPSERRLASGAPGPAYWQQQVDYNIDAVLDAGEKRLRATMTVTYHNNATQALDYLWLELEQNLFRDDSVGTKTRTGGVMAPLEEPFQGGFDVAYIRTPSRDLDWHEYGVVARVDLETPIQPGGTLVFEMAFAFDMPPYLRRMGAEDVEQGTIFEYAQWFPHVCDYDDVNGWNTLPYLGTGEFYTNFGNYEVAITVPHDHIVAASGVLVNPDDVLTQEQISRLATARTSADTVTIRSPEEVDDPASRPEGEEPLTWRFKAENVRTFAWASSDSFIWDACAATVTDLDGSERTVLCQSMYPKEAEAWSPDVEEGGATQYVKHSIEFYSDLLYPFPWPQMTNVNGPEGGMEYPMLVFCGSRKGRGPFGVTDHEVGHSWFPMLVNTDERRHIWMDEGFNTFINIYSSAAFRGREPNPGRARGQTLEMARNSRAQPIDTPPDRMWPRSVGYLGYRKTAMGLYLLREVVLGPDRFDAAFREYVHRWAFKSPQPADFFRTMENASGMDLAWFFRQWFYETGWLDQGVSVEMVDEGAKVVIENYGDQVMPVSVELEYADGTTERRTYPVEIWSYTNEYSFVVDRGEQELTKVTVDPDRVLPDVDGDNNAWSSSGTVEETDADQPEEDEDG